MWTAGSVSGVFSPGIAPLVDPASSFDIHLHGSSICTPTLTMPSFSASLTDSDALVGGRTASTSAFDYFSSAPLETASDYQIVDAPHDAGDLCYQNDATEMTAPSSPASSPDSSVPVSPDSSSPVRDERYLRKRKNNNEAATRSRAKRRQAEKENVERVSALQADNIALRARLEQYAAENANLRNLLATFASQMEAPTKVEA